MLRQKSCRAYKVETIKAVASCHFGWTLSAPLHHHRTGTRVPSPHPSFCGHSCMRVNFMQSGASNQDSSNMIERIRWRSGRGEIERDLAARGAEKPQQPAIMVPNLKSHQDHLRGNQFSNLREAHGLLLSNITIGPVLVLSQTNTKDAW